MATSLVCGIDLGTSNSLCAVSRENTQELVTFGSTNNQYHLQSSIITMEIFLWELKEALEILSPFGLQNDELVRPSMN